MFQKVEVFVKSCFSLMIFEISWNLKRLLMFTWCRIHQACFLNNQDLFVWYVCYCLDSYPDRSCAQPCTEFLASLGPWFSFWRCSATFSKSYSYQLVQERPSISKYYDDEYIVQEWLSSFERRHGLAQPNLVVFDGHFGTAEVVFCWDVMAILWTGLHC